MIQTDADKLPVLTTYELMILKSLQAQATVIAMMLVILTKNI